MKLLELFCGTKSIGKVATKKNWETVSVDILQKFDPTHLCDIRVWDESVYPPGHFDFIWASPPCTEFSLAKTVGYRDIETATDLVRRARLIIEYFNPKAWVIENPLGLLRSQPIMQDIVSYRTTVSYCMYGFQYRKNTDLWTNINFQPLRCHALSLCTEASLTGKHAKTVQRGPSTSVLRDKESNTCYNVGTPGINDRYAVPSQLVDVLLSSAENAFLFGEGNGSSGDYALKRTIALRAIPAMPLSERQLVSKGCDSQSLTPSESRFLWSLINNNSSTD